jgi:hypothetical protein
MLNIILPNSFAMKYYKHQNPVGMLYVCSRGFQPTENKDNNNKKSRRDDITKRYKRQIIKNG